MTPADLERERDAGGLIRLAARWAVAPAARPAARSTTTRFRKSADAAPRRLIEAAWPP